MNDIDTSKIRRLDGGLLLIFRELLRRRRASEVASALGLSQSAVSHALARLRDLFGDPLFVRRPHGLEPTRRALALAPQVEALIDLADKTLRQDRKFDPKQTDRRFMIAAPDFVAAQIGAQLARQLSAAAPNAGFHIQAMPHDAAFDALKRGDLDLALGRFGAARPGFTSEPFYDDRYCAIVRKGHPNFRTSISLAQYKDASHIFSWAPGEGGEGEDLSGASSLRVLAVVPRWLTVLTLVAACDGVGTVPRRLAERHAGVLGLTILKAPFLSHILSVSAVRRAGVEDAGTDWFLRQLKKAVG